MDERGKQGFGRHRERGRSRRLWVLPIAVAVLSVSALLVWMALDGGGGGLPADGDATSPPGTLAATVTALRSPEGPATEPRRLVPRVLSERPHDPEAFTQGFLLHDGRLFESTGLRGRSSLREVDPETGAVIRQIALNDELFGEGLARVEDQLWQLTWQSGQALRFDLETFTSTGGANYDGEGWGLCHDGSRLIMSDGSDRLTFRDPRTFEVLGSVAVTSSGEPVMRLNELECVDDQVWANVWQTNEIVSIDPADGRVTASVDATSLTERALAAASGDMDVLNGIAFDPRTDTFLVTGKLWPRVYEVRFVEPDASRR